MSVIREENQYISLAEEGDGSWRVTVIYPPFADDIAYQVLEISEKYKKQDNLEKKFWTRKNLLIPTKMIFNNYQDAKDIYEMYSHFNGGFGEDENESEKHLINLYNKLEHLKKEQRLLWSAFMDVYNTQTTGECIYMNYPNNAIVVSNIYGQSNTPEDKEADLAHETAHRNQKNKIRKNRSYWEIEFDAIEEQIKILVSSFPSVYTIKSRERTLNMIKFAMAESMEIRHEGYDFDSKTAEQLLEEMEDRVRAETGKENILSDWDEEEIHRLNMETNSEGEEWHQRMESRGWIDADVDEEEELDDSQFIGSDDPKFWQNTKIREEVQ